MNKLTEACKLSLEIMEQEKKAWDGSCNLYDNAIEACNNALKGAIEYVIIFDMDFYYHDTPEKARCEKCAIGDYDDKNPAHTAWDEQIFYWFESLEEVFKAYKDPSKFEFKITGTSRIRLGV